MSDPTEPREDSDRLAPCPFCGSEAEGLTMDAEQDNVNAGAMFVQCTNSRCMASSALIYPLGDDPKPLLLERWNRRASQSDGTSGGWRPIETAPKDGSEFLAVYGHQGNVMQIVRYNYLHGFWQIKGEPEIGFTSNATRWMPLPAAPNQGENHVG